MPESWSLLNSLSWLEAAVSGVLVAANSLLAAAGLDPAGGPAWTAAVVVLVVVVRVALLPLVVRGLRAAHRTAALAPQLRALQARYSRPRLTRDPAELARLRSEQAALYRDAGVSPLAPLLPALLQVPVMIALARVLDGAARGHAVGLLTPVLAVQAGAATLLGAPLSTSLWGSLWGALPGGGAGALLGGGLVLVVAVATWAASHLQLTRGTDPVALEGPVGQAQRATVWLLPLVMAATSAAVPLGLLVYWATSAVWSLGQQLAVLRWLPSPGSPAAAARGARRARRATSAV